MMNAFNKLRGHIQWLFTFIYALLAHMTPVRRWTIYAFVFIVPKIIVFLTRGESGLWRIAYYVELGKLMETHGVLNVWIIGPGSNYVIYSVWLMSKLLLPNTPETAFLVLWLLIMIITDFFTSLFIYKVANMLFGQKRAWLALLLYAFSLTSLGLYMDFNIDFLTVALMMISFYYLLRGESIKSAIASALGGSVKIFPYFVFPVVLISILSRWQKVKWLLTFLASTLAIYLPQLIVNPLIALSPYKWQSARMPWESIYAFFLWLANYPLPKNGEIFFWKDGGIFDNWSYYQTGITAPIWSGVLPVPNYSNWWGTISLFLMLTFGALLLLKKKAEGRSALMSLLYVVCISLVASYGWSGNYLVHLEPLLFILGSQGGFVAYFLIVLNLLEYPTLYFGGIEAAQNIAFGVIPSLTSDPYASYLAMWGYWGAILTRTIILTGIIVMSWRKILNVRFSERLSWIYRLLISWRKIFSIKSSSIYGSIKRKHVFTTIVFVFILIIIATLSYPSLLKPGYGTKIERISFRLDQLDRGIAITVRANGTNAITITGVEINRTLFHITRYLNPYESITMSIDYSWLMNETYELKVLTLEGAYDNLLIRTPVSPPEISLQALATDVTSGEIKVAYEINASSFSQMYLGAFGYEYYRNESLPIYVFYDVNFMSQEALKKADFFIDLANLNGYDVKKLGFEELKQLANTQPKSILILFEPLISKTGAKIWSGIPSILVDQNEDGYAYTESAYEKSLLFDWMKRGLAFIYMSEEPSNPWIVAKNGSIYKLTDHKPFESMMSDLPGLFRGMGYKISEPSEVGQTLGIYGWGFFWAPSTHQLTSVNATYLAYGTNYVDSDPLAAPVFIKVGEGGWVYLGDGRNLDDESLAQDILKIIVHAPWNGFPLHHTKVKMGFLKDRQINVTDELVLSELGEEKIVTIRLLLIAYSMDYDRYTIVSNMLNVK